MTEIEKEKKSKVLNCATCGSPAKVLLVKEWVLTGCKNCKVAAAAYHSFATSEDTWNTLQKIKKLELKVSL